MPAGGNDDNSAHVSSRWRYLKAYIAGSVDYARDAGWCGRNHGGANFVKIISVAAAKSSATQSAELSAVFVSKPVRTRIALIPALCPQCASISLSPTIIERLRSTACSRAPCKIIPGAGLRHFDSVPGTSGQK